MAQIVTSNSLLLDEAPRFLVGESTFKEYMLSDFVYVDKTDFLSKWWNNGAKVTLIVRPRRFFKTTNMSMVKEWFSCNDLMFPFIGTKIMSMPITDLKAARETSLAIFMSLKDIHATEWEGLYSGLRRCMNGVLMDYMEDYKEFSVVFPLEAGSQTIKGKTISFVDHFVLFMKFLSTKKEKKLIILIDEYDKILIDATSSSCEDGYFEEVLEVYRNFLNSLLKDTPFVERAILTGVLPLAANSILSAFNNAVKDTFLSASYEDSFGFTPEEVDILTNGWMPDSARAGLDDLLYGYNSGNSIVYNPWSVINRIVSISQNDPAALNTWSSSGNTEWMSYHKQLSNDEVEKVSSLISGELVTIPLNNEITYRDRMSNFTNFLTYAFYTGYLSFSEASSELISLRIPNNEVRNAWIYNLDKLVEFRSNDNWGEILASLVPEEDCERFLERKLHDLLDECASSWDLVTRENSYHMWVLGLMASLNGTHKISSNREAGAGRFDIAVMPLSRTSKSRNYVIELKLAHSLEALRAEAEIAVKQVKDNRYFRFFENNDDIVIIGLAAFKKQVGVKIEICTKKELVEYSVRKTISKKSTAMAKMKLNLDKK